VLLASNAADAIAHETTTAVHGSRVRYKPERMRSGTRLKHVRFTIYSLRG
jgi:hypothetical protein